MKIELIIGETLIPAELFDHPVASELTELLPLDLVFNDFNQQEKVATLDRSLSLKGAPDTAAPQAGEIGYYGPTQGVVLYYGNPGSWPGLFRIGRFSYDLSALRALPDGTRIRVVVPST